MKKIILLLLVAIVLGCQSEKKSDQVIDSANASPSIFEDTLQVRYDSVKVYSKHPVSSDPRVTDTAKAIITYPVFSSNKINQFIAQKILATSGNEKVDSYQAYVKGFIKGFDDFQESNKDRIQTWFLDINTVVIRQRKSYLSTYTTYINFSGGAHPNSMFLYSNYDPITDKEITLDSLLVPGGRAKLVGIAEKVFRKDEKLGPTESLKGKYFFEKDVFSLNENFTVTKDGLLFLYNPYEIKPYAFGVTKLLIPFNVLQGIAKPNSLIYKPN